MLASPLTFAIGVGADNSNVVAGNELQRQRGISVDKQDDAFCPRVATEAVRSQVYSRSDALLLFVLQTRRTLAFRLMSELLQRYHPLPIVSGGRCGAKPLFPIVTCIYRVFPHSRRSHLGRTVGRAAGGTACQLVPGQDDSMAHAQPDQTGQGFVNGRHRERISGVR